MRHEKPDEEIVVSVFNRQPVITFTESTVCARSWRKEEAARDLITEAISRKTDGARGTETCTASPSLIVMIEGLKLTKADSCAPLPVSVFELTQRYVSTGLHQAVIKQSLSVLSKLRWGCGSTFQDGQRWADITSAEGMDGGGKHRL